MPLCAKLLPIYPGGGSCARLVLRTLFRIKTDFPLPSVSCRRVRSGPGELALIKAISDILFPILDKIFSLTHNWGISIILFAALAKVALIPLTNKQFRSM